jgi:hypothetical protein
MTVVLILNVLLSCLVCLAVIGGLAASIVFQRREAIQDRSRRAGLLRDTTATRVRTAEAAPSGA